MSQENEKTIASLNEENQVYLSPSMMYVHEFTHRNISSIFMLYEKQAHNRRQLWYETCTQQVELVGLPIVYLHG